MNISFTGAQILLRGREYKLQKSDGRTLHDGLKPPFSLDSNNPIAIDSNHIVYSVKDKQNKLTKLYLSNGDVITTKVPWDSIVDAKRLGSDCIMGKL